MKKQKQWKQNPKTDYPSDVSDEEWALVAPYLTLMEHEAPQREYPLRTVFNALRWIVRAGAPWRMMPNDLPPWQVVYQQTQRWITNGVFETIVQDLRMLLRLAEKRHPDPSAAIFDSRTMQSTPESGARAGYDGAKPRKGSKVHMAVDCRSGLYGPDSRRSRSGARHCAGGCQAAGGEARVCVIATALGCRA